jgi:hypothetical protein
MKGSTFVAFLVSMSDTLYSRVSASLHDYILATNDEDLVASAEYDIFHCANVLIALCY